MQDVFIDSYRILKKGGRCCFVIGNTRLRKVDILNAEVFAENDIPENIVFDHRQIIEDYYRWKKLS